MKSFFSSPVSKFNILMACSTFCISVFSIPVSASPQEVCTKTSSGQVVCGTPVEKPTSTSNQADNDETIQTEAMNNGIVWELKSCKRKQTKVTCNFTATSNQDTVLQVGGEGLGSLKMVDSQGNVYNAHMFKMGKYVVTGGNGIYSNFVKDIQYKVFLEFVQIPTSTPYISLLDFANIIKFRNVPIINPDGTFAPVPDTPKPRVSQPSPNNPSKPKICLPLVGCL